MAYQDSIERQLWNAVKQLQTIVSFMNTGAHPDDERSDFLAFLSRGVGVQTSAIIANRGEGGQNAIGDETGDALGVLRTKEMIAAAHILGIDVVHLSETTNDPIYDFGIEKTAEDTLAKWGEQTTYERLIRHIRRLRPDIVMPCFRDNDREHGHHRAITALTLKAFRDANDPAIFPEQFKDGTAPWQIKKLYLPVESMDDATLSVEIGKMDPIYQLTYPQLGEQSRYSHRTQGMGEDLQPESRKFGLELVDSNIAGLIDDQLFTGIPFNFKELAVAGDLDIELTSRFLSLQEKLDRIITLFPNKEQIFSLTEDALKEVDNLIEMIQHSALPVTKKNEVLHKLTIKRAQLNEVGFLSASIKVEPLLQSTILTRGEETTIQLKITNNGNLPVSFVQANLQFPANWLIKKDHTFEQLLPNETKIIKFSVVVPQDAAYSHPYELEKFKATVQFTKGDTSIKFVQSLDQITVLPDVSLTLTPDHVVINTKNKRNKITVHVTVKNYTSLPSTARITLNTPEDWKLIAKEDTVQFQHQFEEEQLEFLLIPPRNVENGQFEIQAYATVQNQVFNSTIKQIAYRHIDTTYYQYPAQLKATAFELTMPQSLKIGYIESGFDKVADALLATNFDITKLTEIDLAQRDLSIYDTIVIGIRAYLSRNDLRKYHNRILQYVRNGGHVVVQYHKPTDGWEEHVPSPYPFKLGTPSIRWRIADEKAKVTITEPNSKLFSYPNTIYQADWENWVQERGLYFPMEWSKQFQTVLQIADRNEAPLESGILLANYGKGTYLYTNLVFYRQIQNQVPGGYRMFTNLLSYGKAKQVKVSEKPILNNHLQIS